MEALFIFDLHAGLFLVQRAMVHQLKIFILQLSIFFVFLQAAVVSPLSLQANHKRVYIIIVDHESKPDPFPTLLHWYSSLLSTLSSSSFQIHHHYSSLFHGFSATLTRTEAKRITNCEGILAVTQDYLLQPLTTRSPAFLGLDSNSLHKLPAISNGDSSIIAVIDTGVDPIHPSFCNDSGLGPLPAKWKGCCDHPTCNKKLIGMRSFDTGYVAEFGKHNSTPCDIDGHGTHVASILAGSPVNNAEFNGFAAGTARGVATKARISSYKVCWENGCMVSDIISAVERAATDGCDVISLSLGSSTPAPSYSLDPLAIATFRASLKGVFIAAAAGNGGPFPESVGNSPPWITTVGAATIDRDFPASVILGNGSPIKGVSVTVLPKNRISIPYPLVSVGEISSISCINLSRSKINGSYVFWKAASARVSRVEVGRVLKQAGAEGMVVGHDAVDPMGLLAEPHVVPTVALGADEQAMQLIDAYLESCSNPTVSVISNGTVLIWRSLSTGVVPSFSARGPDSAVPWVLKPDIVAPGVNILAAWTADEIDSSNTEQTNKRPIFNILSGTSMAAPHIAGVAAWIKAARPKWGPWDIKSAMMTTAVTSAVLDEYYLGAVASPLAMGAGYVSPEKALNPGLVYDMGYKDYVGLLCGLNYTVKEIKTVVGGGLNGLVCNREVKSLLGFNYPAFIVNEDELVRGSGEVTFTRRLKTVDDNGVGRKYTAEVVAPGGCMVEIVPRQLWFGGEVGEVLEFKLVLRRQNVSEVKKKKSSSGVLRWKEEAGRRSIVSCPIFILP